MFFRQPIPGTSFLRFLHHHLLPHRGHAVETHEQETMATSRPTPHISLEFCVNRRKVHMNLVTVVEKVGRTFQPLAAGPMHVHAPMHASTLTTDFRNALNLIWKADTQSLPFPRAAATQGRHPCLSPRDAKEERGEPKQARPAPVNRDRGGCMSYLLSRSCIVC